MSKFVLSLQVLLSIKVLTQTKTVFNNFQVTKSNFGKGSLQQNDNNKIISKQLEFKVILFKLDNQNYLVEQNEFNNGLNTEISDETNNKILKYSRHRINLDNQIDFKASGLAILNNGDNNKTKINSDLSILLITKKDNSLRRKSCSKSKAYRGMGTCDRRLLKSCKTACKKAHKNVCLYYKCSEKIQMKFISKCSLYCRKIFKKAFHGYV